MLSWKSAHATTAQLSWHLQNFIAITSLHLGWKQKELSVKFELWWKNRSWNEPLTSIKRTRWYSLCSPSCEGSGFFSWVSVCFNWEASNLAMPAAISEGTLGLDMMICKRRNTPVTCASLYLMWLIEGCKLSAGEGVSHKPTEAMPKMILRAVSIKRC